MGEEESKRSDKTDSGELKLICFFDDSRAPTVIKYINETLSNSISLPSLTIQICFSPFTSQSSSYLFYKSFSPKLLIPFLFHPAQIVVSSPLLSISDVLFSSRPPCLFIHLFHGPFLFALSIFSFSPALWPLSVLLLILIFLLFPIQTFSLSVLSAPSLFPLSPWTTFFPSFLFAASHSFPLLLWDVLLSSSV